MQVAVKFISFPNNSSSLDMANLEIYDLPAAIRDLEYQNDTTMLDYFQTLINNARQDNNAYKTAFSALVHMEEAASSKHMQHFDMKSVLLTMHSNNEKICKVEYDVSSIY